VSYSNWRGTSGWGAISDPTGVLAKQVLAAVAGATSSAEDYLQQEIGSSDPWSKPHYRVEAAFAFYDGTDAHPLANGALGLIARAGQFTGSPADARDCYLAEMDVGSGVARISRRNSDVSTVLVTSALDASRYSRGIRHSIRFDCFAGQTSAVRLALAVDGVTLATVGDSGSMRLLSGEPGIRVESGTAYLDDFTVFEFTADGQAPADWTPANLSNVAAWWKADAGLTLAGSSVSSWADSSANSNDLSQAVAGDQPQRVIDGLNSTDVVSFAGGTYSLSAADHSSLDLAADGLSLFAVAKPQSGAGSSVLLDKASTADDSIPTYRVGFASGQGGRSWQFVGTASKVVAATAAVDAYSIFEVVTDEAGSGTGLLAVNGTVALTFASVGPGADSTKSVIVGKSALGSEPFGGDLAEVILVAREVSLSERQKIEGYLAQKWGLQIFLPADHPYRDRSPTV